VSDQRHAWIEFICSDRHPGRFLAPIGESEPTVADAVLTDPLLARFLDRLLGGTRDVALLAVTPRLLSKASIAFFDHDLPRFARMLASEIRRPVRVVGPAVRGRPVWHRTHIGRLQGRLGPAELAVSVPVRFFDLPENRVVVTLLARAGKALDLVERRIGSGHLHRRLAATRRAILDAQWHVDVREIPVADRITPTMHGAAMRNRDPLFGRASELLQGLDRLLDEARSGRRAASQELLRRRWFAPLSDDDLFELYVLVLVMDVLGTELGLGDPVEYGLVAAGHEHVAACTLTEGGRLEVHFNQSPATILGRLSRYRRILLVEVKKTTDGAYTSDSVYKAFGYLWDFAELWSSQDRSCRLVLFFPAMVHPAWKRGEEEPEVIALSPEDRDRLAEALQRWLRQS
jgi:hypothetical protein